MSSAILDIDLAAIAENWKALDRMTGCETAAVVKADGYGLGARQVAATLATVGARRFCVALAREGVNLRDAVGPGPEIYVFAGHMEGDAEAISGASLTPMLNSIDQMLRHVETLPGSPFGVQLDTGMSRLGMAPAEWAALRDIALGQSPALIISHLACADAPDHPMNAAQLRVFHEITDGVGVPRSLAATGGILMGRDYHFDMTRPGIGLYGGLPFTAARPVVRLDLPVIQIRDVPVGGTVGYGGVWRAQRQSRIATVSGGYADGLIRAIGSGVNLFAGTVPCPLVGRVSMDLLTVDVTDLPGAPASLSILGPGQDVDGLAEAAGTIGYEILTSLGARYRRQYRR